MWSSKEDITLFIRVPVIMNHSVLTNLNSQQNYICLNNFKTFIYVSCLFLIMLNGGIIRYPYISILTNTIQTQGELQVLMVLLRDMEGRLKTVESSLAAICNDIRTAVLPESVAPKQPRGQGSARPTQGQHKQTAGHCAVPSLAQPPVSSRVPKS